MLSVFMFENSGANSRQCFKSSGYVLVSSWLDPLMVLVRGKLFWICSGLVGGFFFVLEALSYGGITVIAPLSLS